METETRPFHETVETLHLAIIMGVAINYNNENDVFMQWENENAFLSKYEIYEIYEKLNIFFVEINKNGQAPCSIHLSLFCTLSSIIFKFLFSDIAISC